MNKDHKAQEVRPDPEVRLGHQDNQAHLDHVGNQVQMEVLDKEVVQDRVERMELLVPLDKEVCQVYRGQLDKQDLVAQQAREDHQAIEENWDHLD